MCLWGYLWHANDDDDDGDDDGYADGYCYDSVNDGAGASNTLVGIRHLLFRQCYVKR